MSIIVGVRKGDTAAIAADSQTTQGSIRISGDELVNPAKIHFIDPSYIGVCGLSSHKLVIRSLVRSQPELFDLTDEDSIFETLRRIHPILKDEYFLETNEDDKEQEYESTQLTGMIISPGGVFHFCSYREVSAHARFYADGCGLQYALGAMEVLYEMDLDAQSIAKAAVMAACKFDTGCGPPVQCFELKLNAQRI